MTAPSQTSEIAAPVATAAQFVPALRNAAAAGLVAFGLSFPIISYHAESNINNELVLTGRWPLSFGIAAIVFAFVFLRQMARADWRIWFDRVGSIAAGGMGGALVQAAREGEGTAPPSAARVAFGRYVGPFMLGLVILFPFICPWPPRAGRLAEVDQQLRRPDSDLRDAGLGIEHRGRPRRPSRSRLRGLLRGRRLFLCAALDHLRPFVLDLPAARRNPRRDVGRHSRLPGPEASRRLSRDRDARLRRDHPDGADQLGRSDQRLRRHQRHSARVVLRHTVH